MEGRVGRGSTGDLGPGTVYWVMEDDATLTVPSGTGATVVNGLVGSKNSPVARALHTVTTQATNPRLIRIAAAIFENAVADTGSGVQSPAIDDVGGAIIVQPGSYVALSGHSNAGASPLVTESIMWLEVPV